MFTAHFSAILNISGDLPTEGRSLNRPGGSHGSQPPTSWTCLAPRGARLGFAGRAAGRGPGYGRGRAGASVLGEHPAVLWRHPTVLRQYPAVLRQPEAVLR